VRLCIIETRTAKGAHHEDSRRHHIAATDARFADFDRQVDRAVRLSLLEADVKHHSPFGPGQTSIPCPSDQETA
jgi:hypothetical protein